MVQDSLVKPKTSSFSNQDRSASVLLSRKLAMRFLGLFLKNFPAVFTAAFRVPLFSWGPYKHKSPVI